ncbi:hypothetical protein EA632_11585 [Salmonella enterica]|nr:hypothetical protein [Salmonella enterica subsp. enterica serovar Infantis]EAR0340991.1 hypothetical protein [Salmonella enterica subsp. enterica serovar Anatum]EAR0377644.1 hypothetical protein [Salmonella enterica subsp. enterica serovar Give]EAS2082363.1 hypothetical protein [Salmonella enterica]ECI0119921.1 hypothetical protein [Salmonella enterica subsp. enterica serovar Abaetetuba]
MRKYTAYHPGEERFDSQLYRIMVRAERRERKTHRADIPLSQPPAPETPPVICPARQVMNIYRELEAEKEHEKLERSRRILTHKAEIAARYLKKQER